jgi:hypothetical protein
MVWNGRIGTAAVIVVFSIFPMSVVAESSSDDWLRFVCETGIREEQLELDDARLEVDLSGQALAAYEEIYSQIAQLWEQDAIERMVYLEARYDRDAARLALERAGLLLERQEALIEQYRIVCGQTGARGDAARTKQELDRQIEAYREADCEARAKAVEVAKVNLAFDREWLASILELREADVATRPQVILAELELEQEQVRLADAERRARICRQGPGSSGSRQSNGPTTTRSADTR